MLLILLDKQKAGNPMAVAHGITGLQLYARATRLYLDINLSKTDCKSNNVILCSHPKNKVANG
jgi:broad specificity phosphatase PhoE